eukprot:scaffold4554_cov178-Amphora_coffeaeformis.AAC.7
MPLHLRHGHHQTAEGVSGIAIQPGNASCSPSNAPSTASSETLFTQSSSNKKRKQKYSSKSQFFASTTTTACLWFRIILFLGALTAYVQLGFWSISSKEQSTRKILLRNEANSIEFQAIPPAMEDNQLHNQQLVEKINNISTITAPLTQATDWSHYTVRINTWKRPDQLRVSVEHFLTCERVATIQVIWCTAQGPLPEWLETWQNQESRLMVELHSENSLNERFDVLETPPTKGILTVDDDVLRPCFAFDVAFAKWTSNPDRMVGFDARTHVVESDGTWKYGYLSTTTHTNRYSMTLSRCAFVHVDHLRSYTHDIPAEYRAMVMEHMNCEDILLSFWVSHLTNCQPPLLADYWAMKTMIKMYSPQAISGTSQHKHIRDVCVDTFRRGFELDCLQPAEWIHHDEQTHTPDVWETGVRAATRFVDSQSSIERTVREWKQGGLSLMGEEVGELIQETLALPYGTGLIEGSPNWKKKYHKNAA